MSVTPQQRAQVLYLRNIEAMSAVLIALMTGLSVATVKRVVQRADPKEVPVVKKAAAIRPSSKGRIEREIHSLRHRLEQGLMAAASPRRRARQERRHDRT